MKYVILATIFGLAAIFYGQFILANQSTVQISSSTKEFNNLIDDYFDSFFKFNPSQGTAAGFHRYDGFLEDFSKQSIANQADILRKFLQRFESIPTQNLNQDQKINLALLTNHIRGQLLKLEQLRMWEKDPTFYLSMISNSIFLLMSRDFAPAEARLKSVITREEQAVKLLQQSKLNLQNCPKIYCDLALEQLPSTVDFFKNDVPQAFHNPKNQKFIHANQELIQALVEYQRWIQTELLPRAHGNFAIGRNNLRKMLLYNEMVDVPLNRLLEIGYDNLRYDQQWLKEVANKINPNMSVADHLKALQKKHPHPDKLLQTFRDTVNQVQNFIATHQIVTIPPSPPPVIIPTPSFARALTFAAMETPGPYDASTVASFFEVTLPETSWSQEKINEYMASFNQSSIVTTTAHEVHPGHYTQYLFMRLSKDKVRKLIGSDSNSEGWALYCEQMVLDEGYGDHNPELRLGQLLDTLLRDARYIVSIKMHTGQMTHQQAVQFFIREAYLTPTSALLEANRGTNDPGYLNYTLGKLEILKLRTDYQKLHKKNFSLKKFHDEFLQQGFPPILLVRQKMLGEFAGNQADLLDLKHRDFTK